MRGFILHRIQPRARSQLRLRGTVDITKSKDYQRLAADDRSDSVITPFENARQNVDFCRYRGRDVKLLQQIDGDVAA